MFAETKKRGTHDWYAEVLGSGVCKQRANGLREQMRAEREENRIGLLCAPLLPRARRVATSRPFQPGTCSKDLWLGIVERRSDFPPSVG